MFIIHSMTLSHFHHDQIAKDGFTVVRGFLTPEEVDTYKTASKNVIQYARDGNWPHVRTRGKQFPPWPKNFSPDIWGVSSLMNPGLGELSVPFQEFYSLEKMLAVPSDILQTQPDKLSMELLNMLINPLTDFDLEWHRDTIKPDVTPEEEADQLLQDPYAGCQFNLALTEDSCLIVVPRSHSRIRTDEEREKTTDDSKRKHITGQISVDLHPGDLVFYNSNILHRALYSAKKERITLHGSYGHSDHGKSRAMGVLQHGVGDWIDDFKPINPTMKMLLSKLLALAHEYRGQDLGFALNG